MGGREGQRGCALHPLPHTHTHTTHTQAGHALALSDLHAELQAREAHAQVLAARLAAHEERRHAPAGAHTTLAPLQPQPPRGAREWGPPLAPHEPLFEPKARGASAWGDVRPGPGGGGAGAQAGAGGSGGGAGGSGGEAEGVGAAGGWARGRGDAWGGAGRDQGPAGALHAGAHPAVEGWLLGGGAEGEEEAEGGSGHVGGGGPGLTARTAGGASEPGDGAGLLSDFPIASFMRDTLQQLSSSGGSSGQGGEA